MRSPMEDTINFAKSLTNKISNDLLDANGKFKNKKSKIAYYVLSNGKKIPKDFKENLEKTKEILAGDKNE